MTSTGISAAKVGILVGVSADTVRRHHAEWSASQGFPRPIFSDALLRWDELAVVDWKRRRSQRAQAAQQLEPDWAAIARARGRALLAGLDPDTIAV